MLGKHSGKEKEGDLGGLLFSLHFSIASAGWFGGVFFFFSIKPKERKRTETKYKWVLSL